MTERQVRGAYIPPEIWEREELTLIEKHIFSEIYFFNQNGECFASNEHFAKRFTLTLRRVQQVLQKLKDKGFIKIDLFYREGTKEVEKRIITSLFKFTLITEEQVSATPHEENFTTSRNKFQEVTKEISGGHEESFMTPHEENFVTPPEENFVDNIHSSYTTNIKNNNKNNILLISDETSKKATQLESEFERLWKLYPRKQSKKKAFESFKKARKDKKVPYETIENGLYRYLRYIEQQDADSQFIPHGSTWFSQHRWQDEYDYVTTQKRANSPLEMYRRQFGGIEDEPKRNTSIFDYNEGGVPTHLQESSYF